MTARSDTSELLILTLSAANMVVLVTELLASVVAGIVLVSTAPSAELVRCLAGIALSGVHFACFTKVTAAAVPAPAKIAGLAVLQFASFALGVLLLLGPL